MKLFLSGESIQNLALPTLLLQSTLNAKSVVATTAAATVILPQNAAENYDAEGVPWITRPTNAASKLHDAATATEITFRDADPAQNNNVS